MKLADDAKILLAGEGLRIHPGKRELDLSIRTGEIIGLYGLVGFLDQLRAGIF